MQSPLYKFTLSYAPHPPLGGREQAELVNRDKDGRAEDKQGGRGLDRSLVIEESK